MKKIFSNLGVLLICGIFALVGCSDFSADLEEVNKKVKVNEEAIEALKKDIADLKTEFVNKYATLNEINDILTTVADLQEQINSKASNDDVNGLTETVTGFNELINAMKTTHLNDVTTLNTELGNLKEELAKVIKELEGNNGANTDEDDHSAIEKAITDLQTSLQTLSSSYEAYKTEVNKALESINTQLDKINTTIEKVPELATEVNGINDAITQLQDALEAQNKAIAGKADADDLDALQQKINALTETVNDMSQYVDDQVAGLESKIRALIADSQYDDSELLEKITNLNGQYTALANTLSKIESQIEELRSVLRSIVAVPQTMYNGTKAIQFKSFSYLPLNEDGSYEENRIVKYEENGTDVYYLFNPSVFDVTKASYSIVCENVEYITKSADAPLYIAGTPVPANDGVSGKVKVALKRGSGAANMFALAATLNDGAVVYSDYVGIIDSQIKGEDFVLVNANNAPVAAAAENAELITLKVGNQFDFNPYVKVADLDHTQYGLKIRYSLESGALQLVDGVAVPTISAEGNSIVKVELYDEENQKVIKRGYLAVEVKVPGTFIKATATATVEASRTAFEVAAIPTWIKDLKDQPNTIELIKNALAAVKEGKIDLAVEYLGGVPGFVTYTKTFVGTGEASVRVAENVEEALDSMLPDVDNIKSVADLKAFMVKLTERYEESAYMELINNIKITDYIPVESIKNALSSIPIIGGTLNNQFGNIFTTIENTSIKDLLLNDNVFNALTTIESLANKVNINLFDLSKIKSAIIEVVSRIEGDVANGIIESAEQVATIEAKAEASALATENLIANFNAANAEIEENFYNGSWGIAKKVIESDIATKLFEELGLADVQATLISLSDYGLVLAQYDQKDLLNTKISNITTEKYTEE